MKDPINDLQVAIIHWLQNADEVTALVGDRIYDWINEDSDFPYISIGPADQTTEIADCFDMATVTMQIDCWSREPGFYQVRAVAKAVLDTLHDREIALADNALVSMTLVNNQSMRDPDGLTSHSALTFRAEIQQGRTSVPPGGFVPETRKIETEGYVTGGGNLSSDLSIGLTDEANALLEKARDAVQTSFMFRGDGVIMLQHFDPDDPIDHQPRDMTKDIIIRLSPTYIEYMFFGYSAWLLLWLEGQEGQIIVKRRDPVSGETYPEWIDAPQTDAIGTVKILALQDIPPQWLECNGTEVSRQEYPELFAVIGTTWGAGNGSTTFNLPIWYGSESTLKAYILAK